MKGLLKGLKYFTQMFVEEEEEENDDIQIGLPTDVKHVAHIGWDGPSANSPSWMEDFKSTPSIQANGETRTKDVEQSPDPSTEKSAVKESPGRDLPGLPKSSRRQQSWDSEGSGDSPNGSPTNKTKSSKRRHKNKENSSASASKGESSSLPNMPKKSKKKKPKEKSSRQESKHDGSSKQYREANSNT